MRAVNLLPKDVGRQQRKAPSPPVLVGAGGGTLVFGVLTLLLLGASGDVGEKRTALELAQRELASIPAVSSSGPNPVDVALTDQRTQRAAAVSSALGERVAWDRVLRRFSLVLPEDVWLTSLAATAPDGSETGEPKGFSITGYTYSHEAVARLLSRVSVVPDLTNVFLRRSTLSDIDGRPVVEFEILADIRKAEPTT